MSHNPIRKDKTCLNCRHVVDQRFCPNCGQENSESRKTFHHLFIHFFEDLTHYENAFWRTIRNLLFRPASLTIEYLSGKRLSYLAPVRLYIFISFVTFLLIAVMPETPTKFIKVNNGTKTSKVEKVKTPEHFRKEKKIEELKKAGIINRREADSLRKVLEKIQEKKISGFLNFGYQSAAEIDSIQKYGSEDDKLTDFEYWVAMKTQLVKENNTDEQIKKKFKESFIHNFPKVLFIYMPIFALFLWLFHGKKRWYYFDHGIFTLHYFSFLLLIALILFLINKLFTSFLDLKTAEDVVGVFYLAGFGWMVWYFFPAHRRFYMESRWMSFFKSLMLFFINFVLIILILCLFAVYTFINLH